MKDTTDLSSPKKKNNTSTKNSTMSQGTTPSCKSSRINNFGNV